MYHGYYRYDISLENAFEKEELEVFNKYKRFIIVGCSSSGKSTLAKQIANKYSDLKRIELDYLWWLPQWTERDVKEFQSLVIQSMNKFNESGWIIDGNYRNVRDITWSKGDVVIWLDYEFWNVFYRACKRTFQRILFKESVCNGNIETLWGFISDPLQGIPFWVWRRHHVFQERIPRYQTEYPHIKIIRIKSPYHCDYWFNNLM